MTFRLPTRLSADAEQRRRAIAEDALVSLHEDNSRATLVHQILVEAGYAYDIATRMVVRTRGLRIPHRHRWPAPFACLVMLLISTAAFAHGGGVDKFGCHNDRKTGTHHCHGAQVTSGDTAAPKLEATFIPLNGDARVIDGDTLEIGETRIRLWGIDAPETDQLCTRDSLPWACGEDATEELAKLLDGRFLICTKRAIDRYGRLVASCASAEMDISAEMVRQGYALDYAKYSDGQYRLQQAEAKANHRGLWASEFTPPWQYRSKR